MKNLLIGFAVLMFFLVPGCKSDSPTGGGGLGGGGGGGGTGSVTFTISVVQDQQGQVFLQFQPNTSATITSIKAVCQAINVDETVTDNSGTVYNSNNPINIGPLTVLQTGQQWTFTIKGKVGSATGQDYTVTVNYTIPAGVGGGGGGSVNFTVAVVQDQQQQPFFELKPDKDVVVNTVRVVCQALNVDETLTDQSGSVYNANNPIHLGPVQGLQQGQQWVFTITGKIGSTTGQAYTVTVNYTIP